MLFLRGGRLLSKGWRGRGHSKGVRGCFLNGGVIQKGGLFFRGEGVSSRRGLLSRWEVRLFPGLCAFTGLCASPDNTTTTNTTTTTANTTTTNNNNSSNNNNTTTTNSKGNGNGNGNSNSNSNNNVNVNVNVNNSSSNNSNSNSNSNNNNNNNNNSAFTDLCAALLVAFLAFLP